MAALRITHEVIFQAAEVLDAAGQVPTLAAVRKAIGGGSFTTISEGMKEWRSLRAEKTDSPSVIREPAPDFLAARIESVAAELWAVAKDKADEKLQSEREAMSQARDQLEDQKREAAELADQMESDLQLERDQIEIYKINIENLESTTDRISSEINIEREARISAESRANMFEAALSEARSSIEGLRISSDRLANDLTYEREARFRAENDARAKTAEAGELDGRLAAEREKSSDFSNRLISAESNYQSLVGSSARFEAQAAAAESELSRLRVDLENVRIDAKAASSEAAELRGKLLAFKPKN